MFHKTIEVTRDRIDKGVMDHCRKCPVALAIMDATGIDDVSVNGETATFRKFSPDRTVSRLPREVQEWIEAFDGGSDMLPFSFKLEVP